MTTKDFLQFDLNAEIETLDKLKPWKSGLRSSVLLKTEDMRVVLIAMESGAKMKEHHAEGTVAIHALRGAIRFHVQGRTVTLEAGQLLTIPPRIEHDVEAIRESALLLTISWPTNQQANP